MTDLRIEITAEDEGTPPDAVTLQDSTGTFGVRRKDTLEVVVASGTAMVQDATDLTLWRYTVADVVPGVTYEYVAKINYADATDYFESERLIPDEAECAAMLTVGQVDAILASHVTSADLADWTGLSTADKGVYICRAQAMIDAGSWDGTLYDDDQEHAFPRLDDDDDLIGEENDADPDSPLPPTRILEALALLAFSFVHRADVWDRRQSQTSGLASQSVAGISEAYVSAGGTSEVRRDLSAIPEVWARLAAFWRVGGRII